MKGYYKVPGRQVWCNGLGVWLKATIRCHIGYRISPPILPKLPE